MTQSLPELIQKAKDAVACEEELDIIKTFSTWEEATKHPEAPFWAYWYARNVLKSRWPEAEPVILSNPHWACWYALNVIKGRWPEGEPTIATDPHWAYQYARTVLKSRWPEAEAIIATNQFWKSKYEYYFQVAL